MLLGLAVSNAPAGIVLDGAPPAQAAAVPRPAMRSILLAPGPQSETGYLIQRSFAWRNYQPSEPHTGILLVYPPAVGGVGTPSSIRQLAVRNHLSRAHAYRIGQSKK